MPFNVENYLNGLKGEFGTPIRWFDELDSTNSFLGEVVNGNHGEVVGADSQTAGRGRSGRRWMDEPGKSLLFSLHLIYPSSDKRVGLAPLITATALAQALESVATPIQIKWPNDLVSGTKKLAGILVEAKTTGDQTRLIIGAGININQTSFPSIEGAEPVSLAMLAGREFFREIVLAGVMNSLSVCFEHQTPAEILSRYRRRCVTIGQTIEFTDQGMRKTGRAEGIDEMGRLQIVSDGEQISYFGNEITHIRNQP